MKTITMNFEEYEKIVGERNKTAEEFSRYQYAVEVVFGEKASNVLETADKIEESQRLSKLRTAMMNGQL